MTGWLGSSVVVYSHGQRKALGSSPGRATMFHLLHIVWNDNQFRVGSDKINELRVIERFNVQFGNMVEIINVQLLPESKTMCKLRLQTMSMFVIVLE